MGRIVVVLALLVLSVLLPSATFAGGVALAVPSCQTNVQSVQLQGLQAYAAPVALAVPVYAQQQQFVQVLGVQQHQVAVQAVRVQQVQVLNANKHVRVQVVNEPRTAIGAAIQAFRDRRFGR
jgi:hypothetical protein